VIGAVVDGGGTSRIQSLWNPYTRPAATHEVALVIWGTDVLNSRRPPLRLIKRVCMGRFASLRFAPTHFACPVGVRNMQ